MPIHLTCPVCGAAFTRYPAQIARRNSCSRACSRRMPTTDPAYENDGRTAIIPLYARDGAVVGYTKVDADDVAFVNQWTWRLDADGYARRGSSVVTPPLLHRALLGLEHGDHTEVDHISRDTLDNRRANLRTGTHADNMQNKRSYAGSTSPHRGVSWSASKGKWEVNVQVDGHLTYVGAFVSETAAAEAAQTTRRRLMPRAVD